MKIKEAVRQGEMDQRYVHMMAWLLPASQLISRHAPHSWRAAAAGCRLIHTQFYALYAVNVNVDEPAPLDAIME
jgi:hypothetical protein